MSQKIDNIIFSFLLKDKHVVGTLSSAEAQYLQSLSNTLLLAGFILDSCEIDKVNKTLIKNLKHQQKVSAYKFILLRNDLYFVAEEFRKREIEFLILKGMALNLKGVYKFGIRACQDIDILVPKHKIEPAYFALKDLGYYYQNPLTNDRASVLAKHHIPRMINANGSIIELHWRVTSRKFFANCPITPNMFNDKVKVNKDVDIWSPSMIY